MSDSIEEGPRLLGEYDIPGYAAWLVKRAEGKLGRPATEAERGRALLEAAHAATVLAMHVKAWLIEEEGRAEHRRVVARLRGEAP